MKENVYYRVNNVLEKQDFIRFAKFFKKKHNKGFLYFSPNSIKIFAVILVVAMCCVAAVSQFVDPKYLNIILSAFIILSFVILKFTNSYTYGCHLYKYNVKQEEESPINVEILFTDSKMYTKGNKTRASFEYNQILSVSDSGDRYYLQLYNNSYLIIKKECIVFGDSERLPEFIDKIKERINTPNI